MSKQPHTWDDALVNAGLVDPRNGRASRNQLARAVGMSNSALGAVIDGRSTPRAVTIQKIADALKIDVRIVAGWVGQERTERAPYAPPAEADLLTDRQRRAVDEIIRAIAAERAGSHDDRTQHQTPHGTDARMAHQPQPDGSTSEGDDGHAPGTVRLAPEEAHELVARLHSTEISRFTVDELHELEDDLDDLGAAELSPEDREFVEGVRGWLPGLLGRAGEFGDERSSVVPLELAPEDFDFAAKRGRNRGREAREQQDRDAEDGGA